MDAWAWVAQKFLTECGAIGAAGWLVALIVTPQLALERRSREKREQQIRADRIERERRADDRLDRLSEALAEIKGRIARGGDNC